VVIGQGVEKKKFKDSGEGSQAEPASALFWPGAA